MVHCFKDKNLGCNNKNCKLLRVNVSQNLKVYQSVEDHQSLKGKLDPKVAARKYTLLVLYSNPSTNSADTQNIIRGGVELEEEKAQEQLGGKK